MRTKIKPGWERIAREEEPLVTESDLRTLRSNAMAEVAKLNNILKLVDKIIDGSRVLEIGCHSGATSYAIAEQGAQWVVGTEFTGYKVTSVSSTGASDVGRLNEIDDRIRALRSRLSATFPSATEIDFINDDICNSALADASFDMICSWEVLEHLSDPKRAFTNMSRVLRAGGVMVHRYNPFFCLSGGHSLCTLDFLWGHVRLNEDDFQDYVRNFKPDELEKAMSFYHKGLNRMTLHDLRDFLETTDIQIVAIVPLSKEQHLRMVDIEILDQAKTNYPGVQLLDLITPSVLVITKKEDIQIKEASV